MKLMLASRGKIGFIDQIMSVYRKNSRNSWSVMEKDRKWYDDYLQKSLDCLLQFDEFTGFVYSRAIRKNVNRRMALYLVNAARFMSISERAAFLARHPEILRDPVFLKHSAMLLSKPCTRIESQR